MQSGALWSNLVQGDVVWCTLVQVGALGVRWSNLVQVGAVYCKLVQSGASW